MRTSMAIKSLILGVFILLAAAYARANVVGSDIQNFNPTTNGIDFVTVQSSETLEPGIINFGFFLNYAVNSMPNYEEVTTGDRTNFDDTLLGGDLNVGIGLMKNWDVGFSVPQVYSQDSDANATVFQGEVSQTGTTEYRLNTKYRFRGDENGGIAFVGSINFDQVQDNPFAGTDPGPTFNFELAWDTTHSGNAYGVNVGYRKRDSGPQLVGIPIEPFDDQFIASAAISRLLPKWDLKLIGEIYGSFPLEKPDRTTDRDVSTMELLLGVKKDIRHDIALHAGGGTEVYHGSSSPDWRVYTGINWTIGPIWQERAVGDEPQRLESAGTEFFASKPLTPTEKFVAGDVLFAFNSADLSPKFKEVLLQLVQYLKAPPGFKSLVVEGHTDSVGPEAYNLDLSQRRSASVVKFLTEEGGLDKSAVKSVGYGETRPIADNANFQGRARNRRVEFNVVR
jgi:outer membrane protein OmpA-like peptidoglycan-associated protein